MKVAVHLSSFVLPGGPAAIAPTLAAVGRAADLVLVDVSGIDRAGALEDPLAAVVFTGIGQRVHTSIVDGEIVVRDGRLVRVDEDEIARKAQAISTTMLRRAGYAPRFAPPPWLA